MLSITAVIGAESEWEERETLLTFLIEAGEINQEMVHTFNSCFTLLLRASLHDTTVEYNFYHILFLEMYDA